MASPAARQPVPDLDAGARKVFEAQYLTLNEARQREGLPLLAGGHDQFLMISPALIQPIAVDPQFEEFARNKLELTRRILRLWPVITPSDLRPWEERSLDHAVKEAQREVASWFSGEIYVWKPLG